MRTCRSDNAGRLHNRHCPGVGMTIHTLVDARERALSDETVSHGETNGQRALSVRCVVLFLLIQFFTITSTAGDQSGRRDVSSTGHGGRDSIPGFHSYVQGSNPSLYSCTASNFCNHLSVYQTDGLSSLTYGISAAPTRLHLHPPLFTFSQHRSRRQCYVKHNTTEST